MREFRSVTALGLATHDVSMTISRKMDVEQVVTTSRQQMPSRGRSDVQIVRARNFAGDVHGKAQGADQMEDIHIMTPHGDV